MNIGIESKNQINDPKEILNSLLKGMLDHKLNKLEKKHAEETNTLKIMSKISKNIIITLEYYSHKVRKEIYKLRHKNDESHQKKKENYKKNNEFNKTMNKEDKSNNILDNNIDLLMNKENKSLAETANILNKRGSKSIDSKKLSFISENTKKKMDVFARLSSKSIGNFKKLKFDTKENINSNHLNNSKSKNKKKNASSKALHNILNRKNEGDKKSEQSPSNKNNKDSSFNTKNAKLMSTPKTNQKQMKQTPQINTESNNTYSLGQAKLKKNNSKGKLSRRSSKAKTIMLKKEENKDINKIFSRRKSKVDISSKANDKNEENKNVEQKTSKSNNNFEEELPQITKKNENKNVENSFKEKVMDEEILKKVNKDELLISQIKEEEKIDDITEISALNLDDLNIKESINMDIKEKPPNTLLKETNNNEIKSSLNNSKVKTPINSIQKIESGKTSESNSNTTNNNISLIQHQKQNSISENNKSKNNNMNNNIIFPNQKNSPVNFLENEEINFTLVEDSHIEENDNDLNKTIDLNISGLSDQLSLQEKFETHLDEISRYLDMKDLCNLMLINKECFTTIMNILISKIEITIDILEEEINKLKDSNKEIDFSKTAIQPFKLSTNSSRAISLLNNSSGCNLIKFEKNQSINKEIFVIFGIFFIAAGKKKEFFKLNSEEEKINYISNFFKKDIEKMSLGSLIEKEINGKIFDNDQISSLYKYSYKSINIISPSKFQKTNKDVAIFVFVIKNILDHIGMLDQQNIKPEKEYILFNARLKKNKIILEQLNSFFDKIN